MDHPAPSVSLVAILIIVLCVLIAAVAAAFDVPPREAPPISPLALRALVLFGLVVTCFYFWPIYSTYYTLNASGIRVRYGPWTRQYPWSDFSAAYWQKGMFATRIGWPSVTPCVRMTDGILLKRRAKRLGLYLTPNDSRAFLQRIAEFAPDLTAESII